MLLTTFTSTSSSSALSASSRLTPNLCRRLGQFHVSTQSTTTDRIRKRLNLQLKVLVIYCPISVEHQELTCKHLTNHLVPRCLPHLPMPNKTQ
eukprot:3844220-Amphidinium_carterae.1